MTINFIVLYQVVVMKAIYYIPIRLCVPKVPRLKINEYLQITLNYNNRCMLKRLFYPCKKIR